MTDSLKFGPEWLRNLSQDGPSTGSGGGGPRYQLAEHRYGREEMLALFDKTLGQPEILGRFKSLYVERLQPPLALAPTQEEETNLINRGGWMPRPMTGGGASSLRGGRGGGVSVDRGRGRGGRGGYHSQNMVGGGGPAQMGIPYQRSQSGFDTDDIGLRIGRPRPWAEQNGETEWNGTTSPRKEYNATGRANMDNWRRHRGTDDDDGWRNQTEQRRTEKWGRSGGTASSWRDGDTTAGGQEGGPGGDRELLSRGFERLERELRERGGSGSASDRGDRVSHHQQSSGASAVARSWNARKPWDVDDILPEWAMENPSESGGTFDASGAFHGSDDEHDRSSRLNHSHSSNNIHSSPRPATLSRSQTQGSILVNKHADTSNLKRLKENSTNETSHSDEDSNYSNRRCEDNRQSNSARKTKPDREISIEHLEPDQKSTEQSNNTQKTSSQDNAKTETKKQTDSNKNKTDIDISNKQTGSPKKNKKVKEENEQEVTKSADNNKKGNKISSDSSTDDLSSDSSGNRKDDYTKSTNNIQDEMKNLDASKSQPPHDEFARMQEVADDIVAQLMMDEEKTLPVITTGQQQVLSQSLPVTSLGSGGLPVNPGVLSPNVHGVLPPLLPPSQPVGLPIPGSDKWFYRDPQGEVQGPFLASEMSEWYRAGYFTNELLVRRACDDRYTTLGELVKICGGVVPFNSSTRLPPLKQVDTSVLNVNGLPSPLTNQQPQVHPGLVAGSPQYRQAQLLSRQIAARHEAQVQVLRDLSRSERWSTMTPGEQNAVLMQQLAQIPFPDPYVTGSVPAGLGITPPTMPLTQPASIPQHNPLLQLITQMQQAKQTSNMMPQVPPMIDPTKSNTTSGLGNINHLSGLTGHHTGLPMPGALNHLNNLSTNHLTTSALHHHVLNQTIPPPISTPDSLLSQSSDSHKGEDITSMFQQLFSKAANNKSQANDPPASSWNPSWTASNNIGSMWDMPITKPEMKTEQQILEEQMRLRKEAEERENQEKEQKRQIEEAHQQALKAKEKEREKAKKQQQELEDKVKAKKEAEEKEKAEQKRKQQLAEQQKKQQQEQEQKAKKEQEAKAKREAEEKRLRELEEKRRLKEERKEAEMKRKLEAELSSKKAVAAEQEKALEERRQKQIEEEKEREKEKEKEKQKVVAEAKKLLKQQQQAMVNSNKSAPWRPPTETSPNSPSSLSLAEIQKLEREKRAEQLKEQQAQQLALRQQQAALLKEQELALANERSAMQLKWANQKPQISGKVKSLAEIQAEEMAKQAAADRLAAQQRERESPIVQQTPSIWSSTPSLNWANSAWSTGNSGFWEEPPTTQVQNKTPAKSNGKQSSPQNKLTPSNKASAVINQNAHSNHNGGQKINSVSSKQDKNTAANNNNPNSKKKKKDDKDEFTNWCTKAMSSINSSVDAPTFISFLNEIDSPFEVKDYIRTYLGDSKEAVDFSKQFLEKRSRFRNQQRLASAHIDDMCSPAPAINPGSECHEGKGKKSKKNKMQKIDNRILGFNVTAAQDRINIGDRDYGDAN